jgi:hypothetical protein
MRVSTATNEQKFQTAVAHTTNIQTNHGRTHNKYLNQFFGRQYQKTPKSGATMPRSKKEGWIEWRGCEARAVIMRDLIDGILPVEAIRISAEDAWEVYKTMDEFALVVFDQFKARLQDHRKQIGDNKIRAAVELDALEHDRRLFPRQTANQRGEPVFDLHPAKLLLRADVVAGKHLRMTPRELRLTNASYQMFEPDIFRQRIYQEVRRTKFINYLNERRAKGLF